MSHFRIPIGGWKKCLHAAAAFESRGEYAAAVLLDRAASIEWWLRNDPVILRIATPIGSFEPDFVYKYVQRQGAIPEYGILEIKGGVFWDQPGSDARIKGEAAVRWVDAALAADGDMARWEVAIIIDDDAIAAASFEQMRSNARLRRP